MSSQTLLFIDDYATGLHTKRGHLQEPSRASPFPSNTTTVYPLGATDAAMADMRDFDVIRVARSDGLDTGPGYWPLTTTPAPTTKKTGKEAASADKTPRTKPQMVRLAEDDPRFVEWRVKLGILLKQELCPNPDGELVLGKRTVANRSLTRG